MTNRPPSQLRFRRAPARAPQPWWQPREAPWRPFPSVRFSGEGEWRGGTAGSGGRSRRRRRRGGEPDGDVAASGWGPPVARRSPRPPPRWWRRKSLLTWSCLHLVSRSGALGAGCAGGAAGLRPAPSADPQASPRRLGFAWGRGGSGCPCVFENPSQPRLKRTTPNYRPGLPF